MVTFIFEALTLCFLSLPETSQLHSLYILVSCHITTTIPMATQHTEKTILENFLLPPAPLHALLSLKSFSALFPSSQRSSPEIRALYRNLQVQRARTVDKISQNIAEETKRGLQQRRAVVRAREAEEEDDYNDDEEIYLEESVRLSSWLYFLAITK